MLRLVILPPVSYSEVSSVSTQIKIALAAVELGMLGVSKALRGEGVLSAFLMNTGMPYLGS